MKQITSLISVFVIAFFLSGYPVYAITESEWQTLHMGETLYYGGGSGLGGDLCVADRGAGFNLGPMDDGELRRANLVAALMQDLNLTVEQAAGIVGNFMQESGSQLFPDVNEGTSSPAPPDMPASTIEEGPPDGYGWAQWSFGRKTSFVEYAVENGYVESENERFTDAANYSYFLHELDSGYESTVDDLQEQDSAVDAAVSFHDTYERSGDSDQEVIDVRGGNAEGVVEDYRNLGSALEGEGEGCIGISGDYAFPLAINQGDIGNPEIIDDEGETFGKYGHDYTAFDILVDPGTETVAFMEGEVTRTGQDRCGGRTVHAYNEANDMLVVYMHLELDDHVETGETVEPGDFIGVVGGSELGCGTPHLHIDAVDGETRPGCRRGRCPESDRFIDIGPQLYETYQTLSE